MVRVASVGSINVDGVAYLDAGTIAALAENDWFPAPGETRRVETVPESARAHVTERFHGGKGANQAVAAARADADARLFGKVGTDAGERVRAALGERGVDVSGIEDVAGPTGAAYVFVGPDGENHIAVVGGANDAVDRAYVTDHLPAIRRSDAVLVQNEIPAAASVAVLEACDRARNGPLTVCNPAPAPGAEPLLAAGPDVAVVNETEHRAMRDSLAGLPTVVRTRGADPIVVEGTAVPGGRFEVTPPSVDPVDTTGAGDVFAGYLATGLARGEEVERGVRIAAAAASLSTEREGVQRATPAAEEVHAFLEGDPEGASGG